MSKYLYVLFDHLANNYLGCVVLILSITFHFYFDLN